MFWHLFMSVSYVILAVTVPPDVDNHPIRPDPELQARIDRAVATVQSEPYSPLKQLAAYETLRDVESNQPDRLLEQILHYYTNEANPRERRLYAMLMIGHFRYPESTIVKAVTSYIYTDHALLGGEIRRLLSGIENADGFTPTDYSEYRSWVRANKDNPPANLVRYMYERSPGMALLSLMPIYMPSNRIETREAQKPVLWAEHVVSDVLWKQRYGFLEKNQVPREAAAQLEKLSKHEAWWARLYVAEILRQHPQFRTAELIGRLKADEHELVRRAILDIEKRRQKPWTSGRH